MTGSPSIGLGDTQLAVAQVQGYFTAANVKVAYLNGKDATGVVQAVSSGSADMGQADTLALDAAVAKGTTNVVAVCSYVADNISSIAVPDASAVTDLSQLKGKKIGVADLTGDAYESARVALTAAGLDPAKDVTFVTIAQPAAQAEALKKGSVAALATTDLGVGAIEAAGVKLRLFQPTGPMAWQWQVVVAASNFLSAHADAVAGVCKAIQESELYVHASPAAGLAAFKKEGGTVGGLSDAQATSVIQARSEPGFRSYTSGGDQWGWINLDQMNPLADLYHQLGLISQQVDVSSYYTTELLSKMGFSTSTIEAQATGSSG